MGKGIDLPGREVAELSKAYQQLDQAVLARREEFNQAFAKALADWTSVGSTFKGVCGVEDVLSQIVAKVAEANNRVLLIVLDGMSWAVCHELLTTSAGNTGSRQRSMNRRAIPLPVIATVPSVTQLLPHDPAVRQLDQRRCGGREAELRGQSGAEGKSATSGIHPSCSTRRKSRKGPEASLATT